MHSMGSTGAVTVRHVPFFVAMLATHVQTSADAALPVLALTAFYMTLMAVPAAARALTLAGYTAADTKC